LEEAMRRPIALALLALAAAAPPAVAQDNAWLDRKVLNIAHQGGELEAPSNTLHALKTAVAKGTDVLEIDVHATADGEVVVIHDDTVDRTTNGTGQVDELTLAEVQALDAAHWFVPGEGTVRGRPDADYALRGIATGERKPPKGAVREDFRVPTLREVLETFPDELINIEIKATAPQTAPYEEQIAALLAEFGRSDDTIVVSFLDHAIERFELLAPFVDTATGTGQAAAFWASAQGPLPGTPSRHQALQVPTALGVEVVNQAFVDKAHANGLAVHVWTINDRETMERLVDLGVDGVMTDRPELLEQVLAERGVRWDEPAPARGGRLRG
jgi:glycerophosphoryl diester phosphodiesterase